MVLPPTPFHLHVKRDDIERAAAISGRAGKSSVGIDRGDDLSRRLHCRVVRCHTDWHLDASEVQMEMYLLHPACGLR